MRSEHIVLAALPLLNLSRTGIAYTESKDPRVHRRGDPPPDGSWGTLGMITPVQESIFSSANRLGLFEIVRGHDL